MMSYIGKSGSVRRSHIDEYQPAIFCRGIGRVRNERSDASLLVKEDHELLAEKLLFLCQIAQVQTGCQ